MSKRITKSVTITARVSPALGKKLSGYARLTDRTTSAVVERILAEHVDYETWFVKEVRKGIESANRGSLIPHEEAMRRIHDYIAKRKRERRRDRKKAA
jgi:predicted transcriptional regulator